MSKLVFLSAPFSTWHVVGESFHLMPPPSTVSEGLRNHRRNHNWINQPRSFARSLPSMWNVHKYRAVSFSWLSLFEIHGWTCESFPNKAGYDGIVRLAGISSCYREIWWVSLGWAQFFFRTRTKNPSLALTFRKIKYKMHPTRKFKLIKKSRSHGLLWSKCPWNPLRTYGKQFSPSIIHGLLGGGRPRRNAAPCQIELFIIYWSRFFNFFTFDCRAVFPSFKPHSFGHFYDPVYLRNVPRNNLQMAIVKGAYHTWSSSHPFASREKLECFPSPQTERISLSQTYFKIGK